MIEKIQQGKQNKFIKTNISKITTPQNRGVYFKEIHFKRVKIKAKLSKNQRNKLLKYGKNPKININKLSILTHEGFKSFVWYKDLPFKNPNNHILGYKSPQGFRGRKHNKRQGEWGFIININGLNYDTGMFKKVVFNKKDRKTISDTITSSIY